MKARGGPGQIRQFERNFFSKNFNKKCQMFFTQGVSVLHWASRSTMVDRPTHFVRSTTSTTSTNWVARSKVDRPTQYPPPSVRGEPQNGPFWGFWGLLGDPSGAFRAQIRRWVHATVCILSFWCRTNHSGPSQMWPGLAKKIEIFFGCQVPEGLKRLSPFGAKRD